MVLMSDATVNVLVPALVIGIPAFFTGLASFIVALRGSRNVERVADKADTIIGKTTEIHTLTNSNLSRVKNELEAANVKLEGFAEAQRVSGAEIKALQNLVGTLVERERHVEQVVQETNGILRKADSPLPVVDEQLAAKIDKIVTPKLDQIQDSVDEKK